MKKFKFGLLLNNLFLEEWEAEVLKKLLSDPDLHLNLVVIPESDEAQNTSITSKVINYPWKELFYRLHKKWILNKTCFRSIELSEICSGTEIVKVSTQKSPKGREVFMDSDIEKIQTYAPHFLLRFGFGILSGKILNACPWGVWSYHHADPLSIRGGPAGFWEIFNQNKTTSVVLQKLDENLDAGKIWMKGTVNTISHSYKNNVYQTMHIGTHWPLSVFKMLKEGNVPVEIHNQSSVKGKLYKIPNNIAFSRVMIQTFINRFKYHFNHIIKAEFWQSGYVEIKFNDLLLSKELKKICWYNSPGASFYLADPMPAFNGKLVLAELYSYQKNKGWIVSLNNKSKQTEVFLEKDFHLSYPLFLYDRGKNYLLPEASASGKLTLYEMEENKVLKEFVLLNDFPAVDPTVVYHNSKYYLFCTSGFKHTNEELYIYYSDDLKGPYTAHALNPVKTDAFSARPAGPVIFHDNIMYRPSQDCSGEYGKQVVINRIIKLSESEFSEEEVFRIKPPEGYKGMHHISFGEKCYIDVKQYRFNLWHTCYKLFKR